MTGKKILVADDSLTIQKVIRLALSGDGYVIQTVSNGEEALEQASLFRPDICIIDVSLPGHDAYQIREHFNTKTDLKNIPIIMMSSAFEKVDEPRMNALGFAGHLIKPFDPSHLRSTLLSVSNRLQDNDPIEATLQATPHLEMAPSRFSLEPTSTEIKQQTAKDDMVALTQNTFEMAGLDQQEWGVIEPMKSAPETEFQLNTQTFQPAFGSTSVDLQFDRPDVNDHLTQDFNSTNFSAPKLDQPMNLDAVEDMVKIEVERLMEQFHQQLHERIQNEIRQYASQKIPALAESLIKEEIRKLLSEPPV
jgi:CheY-like chemotaxis protein